MLNFRIKCKFCGNDDQKEFQTTINDWDGYSEYTVLDSGSVEFKCLKCGTFGSTDEIKKENGSNKIEMFEITCNHCGSHNYSYQNSLNDESIQKPYIECDDCGVKDGN